MKISDKIIKNILSINVPKTHLLKYLKNRYPRILKEILVETKFLDKFYDRNKENTKISLFERIYCILHNLNDRPLCKTCGKKYVSSFNKQLGEIGEYRKWCSPSCQASDIECILKSKNSRFLKYGDENYCGQDKSRETRYKNNNGKWHSTDYVKKVKMAKMEKYGDENYVNTTKLSETFKKNINKNPNFWNERNEKSKITKLEKYGDENYNNRDQFKKTILSFSEERKQEIIVLRKNTTKEKYGYDSTLQVPEFRNAKVDYYMNNFNCSCL